MSNPIALYCSIFLLGMIFPQWSIAAEPTASLIETQSKLKHVNGKIELLKRTLASANDRRGALSKELSATEKQISEGILKLRSTQQQVSLKEQNISELQHQLNNLNNQLKLQQALLAGHVRARYQTGEYQPLKWILDQDDPYKINRLLTYYHYLITSRQQVIKQIDLTKEKSSKNKEQLHRELVSIQQLQQQLLEHQHQLETSKQYHRDLIQSLNTEIQNNEQDLKDFKKDKQNLSRLLKALAKQSVIQNSTPFIEMRKKLPLPIALSQRTFQKRNQGVTFFAEEGDVVTAVYPGKVVFSDWLRGYGLLLIIDHGQGFMTLYAHNQALFKKKGQLVAQNEQIASVGHSGGIKQNGLYFEIRLHGKAISPLDWLA